MEIIKNKNFSYERALYGLSSASVQNCTFAGEEDGESALKECKNVEIESCLFHLRYPLWHASNFKVAKSEFFESSRAPIWYAQNGIFEDCTINGVKAVRECKDIRAINCKITSPEFGWKCNGLKLEKVDVTAEYFLLDSKDISLNEVTLNGKYSFQYVKGGEILNSKLFTKDAFWHSENLVVKNCILKGEYLGWYSKNLTLIDCHIIGTQPLCYCENLTLINCTTEGCDLAFEYSSVNVKINGFIHSVKNVKSGKVVADQIGEIIKENAVINCTGEVIALNK